MGWESSRRNGCLAEKMDVREKYSANSMARFESITTAASAIIKALGKARVYSANVYWKIELFNKRFNSHLMRHGMVNPAQWNNIT